MEVATPTMHRAHAALGRTGTPIQAYCDLLEVRWLLSERAGHDVGTERALQALAGTGVPSESAAQLAVVATGVAALTLVYVRVERRLPMPHRIPRPALALVRPAGPVPAQGAVATPSYSLLDDMVEHDRALTTAGR